MLPTAFDHRTDTLMFRSCEFRIFCHEISRFLSGTFYSIERLPEFWAALARANPVFYMIDGFRYGLIGRAEGSLGAGLGVVAGVDLALLVLCHWMFATGYRLKT
jgi:ABC-2 type transport system permease protein